MKKQVTYRLDRKVIDYIKMKSIEEGKSYSELAEEYLIEGLGDYYLSFPTDKDKDK